MEGSSSGLPPVGAEARLVGMAAFAASAKRLVSSLTDIDKASEALAAASRSVWGTVASSAASGSASAIASAKATEKALNDLAKASAGGAGGGGKPPAPPIGGFDSENFERDMRRAIDEMDRIRTKSDLEAFNREQARIARLAALQDKADDELDRRRTRDNLDQLKQEEARIAALAAARDRADDALNAQLTRDNLSRFQTEQRRIAALAADREKADDKLNAQLTKENLERFKQEQARIARLAADREKADEAYNAARSRADAERYKDEQARIRQLAADKIKADADAIRQQNRYDVDRVRERIRLEKAGQAELLRDIKAGATVPVATRITAPTEATLGKRAIDSMRASVLGLTRDTDNLGRVSVGSWASFGKNASLSSAAVIRASGAIAIAIAAVTTALNQAGQATKFQQNLKNIEIVAEATGTDIMNLSRATLDMSKEFGIAAIEIQKTETALVKGGASIDQIQQGALRAATALQRATLGEINFADATDLVIQGLNQYGLAASEAERVSNAIAGAANKSTASVNDLSTAFKQAVIPEAVGASIEDVATALALLNSAGLRGSVAGTTLRNTFLRLLDPTKEALDIMKKYNISVFDAQGRSLGFRNVLNQLITAFKLTGDSATDAQKAFDAASLFGARQGSAVSIFARQGIEAFDDLKAAISDTRAIDVATRQLDTFNAQADRLRASISALVIEGLQPLVGALTPVIKGFADTVGAINPLDTVLTALNSAVGRELVAAFRTATVAVNSISSAFSNIDFNSVTSGFGPGLINALRIAQEAFITASAVIATLVTEFFRIPGAASAAGAALDSAPYLAVAAGAIIATQAVIGLTGALLGLFRVFAPVVAGARLVAGVFPIIAAGVIAVLGALALVAGSVIGLTELIVVIGLAIATYAALSQANISVGETFNTLLDIVADVAAGIANYLIESLSEGAAGGIKIISSFVVGAVNLFAALVDGVIEAMGVLPEFVVQVFNFIRQALTNLGKDLDTWIKGWAQAWANVANAVAQALQAAANTIASFLGSLPPQIQEFLGGLFDGAKNFVANTFVPGIGDAFAGLAPDVAGTFEGIRRDIQKNVQAAVDSIQKEIAEAQANLRALEIARGRNEADRPPARPGRPAFEPAEDTGDRLFPSAGGAGGGDGGGGGRKEAEATVRELSLEIQKALADIPGAGKELADFLANIAKDAPQRLQPMIAAIRAVKIEISQTVIAARDLAKTNAAIAASNKEITRLQAAANRIELQQSLALLGFDRQLLGLRFQIMQIAQEEWPIRDRLRDVERQITKLQQDNLDLTRQRLEVQLQLLPLQSALADMEEQINEAQRPNLVLRKEQAQIVLSILPVQQQIAALEREISKTQRTNFELSAAINDNDIAALPIRQAIADLDRQSSRIRTDDIKLVKERVLAETSLIDQRREIFNIDKAIADVANRRLTLEMRRNEILASEAIAESQDQLDALDKALSRETNTAKLRALAKERDKIALSMESQEEALKKINRDQQKQQTQEELRTIQLELQKQAIIDQIKPTQDLIERIQFEEDVYRSLAEVQRVALEEEKRRLEDLLAPLDDVGFALRQQLEQETLLAEQRRIALEAQKQALEDSIQPQLDYNQGIQDRIDLESAWNDFITAALDIEKQKIIDQLKPLQDKLNAITRTQEADNLRSQIALTHLEAERRALQEQLQPLEDRRLAVERQIAVIELEREAVRISFEEQKAVVQEQLLQEQLRRAELEETRLAQQAVFEELAIGLLQAIVNTQAFSATEAAEVAKRLNLWNDEVDAIQKRVVELAALEEAAGRAQVILQGLAQSSADTNTSMGELGEGLDDASAKFVVFEDFMVRNVTPGFEALTRELNSHNRPAFEDLTRELDNNNRPAFEQVTQELDNNNRPAFESLTKELDANNRPAFENLTKELDSNNRPALENITKELDASNRPAFEKLTAELNSNNRPAFEKLTSELNTNTTPALAGVTTEANTGTTPSLNSLANEITASTNPALAAAKIQLDNVAQAAQNAKQQLDAIPREINIIVRYITVGSPPGGAPPQAGGGGGSGGSGGGGSSGPAVPSSPSEPAPPGNESSPTPGSPDFSPQSFRQREVRFQSADVRAQGAQQTIINHNYNFDLDPHYTQVQSPVKLTHDINALIALSQRG